MNNSNNLFQTALSHYNKGNIPQTDALCRHLISIGVELPNAYNLLGQVSLSIGMPSHAATYFKSALAAKASMISAKKNLKKALKETRKHIKKSSSKNRFLLIKAWGSGFWADMDHVIGQLLLAEMTNRTPVVYWGNNSLYHNGACDNAFELYFDPVSDISIRQLTASSLTYFPPKWDSYNLLYSENNKVEGRYSRMAGIYFLARDEDVLISDFHTFINDLTPWVDKQSPLSNMDSQEIYRYLFKKYIRPKSDIMKEIDLYWSENIKNQPVLAVHIRGSDKIIESRELNEINASYDNHIEKYLTDRPDMSIFLLTDSATILDEYKQKYNNRLLYRECSRTENNVGIHYHKHHNKRKIGIEIIIDTYLASMCDCFIGYGGTNVSTTILHLKEWRDTEYTLLGENQLFVPHLFLHNR